MWRLLTRAVIGGDDKESSPVCLRTQTYNLRPVYDYKSQSFYVQDPRELDSGADHRFNQQVAVYDDGCSVCLKPARSCPVDSGGGVL